LSLLYKKIFHRYDLFVFSINHGLSSTIHIIWGYNLCKILAFRLFQSLVLTFDGLMIISALGNQFSSNRLAVPSYIQSGLVVIYAFIGIILLIFCIYTFVHFIGLMFFCSLFEVNISFMIFSDFIFL
jgi:hypothetical protein